MDIVTVGVVVAAAAVVVLQLDRNHRRARRSPMRPGWATPLDRDQSRVLAELEAIGSDRATSDRSGSDLPGTDRHRVRGSDWTTRA